MFVGGVPHGIAGEELARGEQALLEGLGGMERTALSFLAVQGSGNVQQRAQRNQAGEAKNRTEARDQLTDL
ncbi:hypothetical protein D3C71_2035600 [compost metagenome]